MFSKIAKPDMFLEKLPTLITNTLDNILKEKYVGKYAASIKSFTEDLRNTFSSPEEEHEMLCKFLHEHLYPILSQQSSVFASSLEYAFYVGVNSLLNNLEFMGDLLKYVVALGDAQSPQMEVLNIFLGSFMLLLTNEALLFFIRTIHGATINDQVRRKRSNDKTDSRTFLELVYYIGGSVVSTMLFKGKKYKETNHRWELFLEVLQNRFLKKEGVGNSCSASVSHFTESVDRGRLKHISQEALDFFVVLFDLLMSLEGEDGSLPNTVEENVLENNTVLCLWDVLVGSLLHDDDVSLDFLMQVCATCKRIVMKGIMKRRLNENLKKAYSSVALRSRLAD